MGQGATILGCAGPQLTRWERAFFADVQPFGFILFTRNCETPDQVRQLTSDLRASVGYEAPIFIDQEGGRVERLGPPHWRTWLPALDQMARVKPASAARSMYLRYRIIAHELRAAGIDGNCAPLADIAHANTHPVLHNRCYGTDGLTVVSAARAVTQAHLDGGVLPVLKHIPGHGRATMDSHLELPRVDTDADTLWATDFAAFGALADLPLAMTAHIVYSALDRDRCATQSPTMIDHIRRGMGFNGLLMTDDLSMQALDGDMATRTEAALKAGCDIALHCNGDPDEMTAITKAAGTLSPDAQARADRALAARTSPDDADIAAMEAELSEMLA
ncbi:MAG: glycoside hydrolase family 3 N-terminal domain-containing protein [Pseudomonadota bacterium]